MGKVTLTMSEGKQGNWNSVALPLSGLVFLRSSGAFKMSPIHKLKLLNHSFNNLTYVKQYYMFGWLVLPTNLLIRIYTRQLLRGFRCNAIHFGRNKEKN